MRKKTESYTHSMDLWSYYISKMSRIFPFGDQELICLLMLAVETGIEF